MGEARPSVGLGASRVPLRVLVGLIIRLPSARIDIKKHSQSTLHVMQGVQLLGLAVQG